MNSRYKYTYKCDDCNEIFKSRQGLNKHIKNTCKKYEDCIETIKCELCNKNYKNVKSYKYHICKNKNNNSVKILDEIDNLKKIVTEMKSSIAVTTNSHNTTNNNINNGTVNNNITIIPFGNENYREIDLMKHFTTMNFETMFSDMIKEIHYNDDKKEYNNIIIHPKDIKTCHIYTNNRWCETKTQEQIENILTKICNNMQGKYNECIKNITEENEDYKKIQEKYYNYLRNPTKLHIVDNYDKIKDELNGMTYYEYVDICKKYNNLNCFYHRFLTDYINFRHNPVCHTDREIYKFIHKKAIETMTLTIYNECKKKNKSVDGKTGVKYKNKINYEYESDDGDGIDNSELARMMEDY